MGSGTRDLLQRQGELSAIDEALTAARSGEGGLVLIEGAPGIGKTELLRWTVARARQRRLQVLVGRGGELERTLPFGVARQLFEAVAGAAAGEARDTLFAGAAAHAEGVVDPGAVGVRSDAGDPWVVFHGLYWLASNIAADAPLALAIDDAHWSDPASAEWLVYLARRIEGMPVAAIVAARPAEPSAPADDALAALRAEPSTRRIAPQPLTMSSALALTQQALGDRVTDEFSRACHEATGGNPFYLTELLRGLGETGIEGGVADVAAVRRATPAAVTDSILARLGRMGHDAREVARAVSILEPRADLGLVAAQSGLDLDVAAAGADELVAAGLLDAVDPCAFAHPIVRAAVEESLAPAERGLRHARAARLLQEEGAPVTALAAHLLESPATGDAGTVALLVDAAGEARTRGAATEAAAYLSRALQEPPTEEQLPPVLLGLGTAEGLLQRPVAAVHFGRALELAQSPDDLTAAGLGLASALMYAGDPAAAYQLASSLVSRIGSARGEAKLAVEAFALTISLLAGRADETRERGRALARRLTPDSPAACAVLAQVAFQELMAGAPRESVTRLVDRSIFEGALQFTETDYFGSEAPAVMLMWLGEFDRAEALLSGAIETAQRIGSVRSFAYFSAARGFARQLRGNVPASEGDLEPAFATAPSDSLPFAALIAAIAKVRILIERAEAEAAERLAGLAPVPPALEQLPMVQQLRQSGARAVLAQHRFEDAAEGLEAIGRTIQQSGVHNPAILPWRSDLALALAGAGRREEALAAAREEVALADAADIDHARGAALRALGLVEGGEPGLEALEASVAAHERSQARLEYARALCDFGAALRRAKRRSDGRDRLAPALDIAVECGGHAVAERAREELAALGARPRGVVLSGAELLTASERRVCQLAADGLSNPEIAQALFVTRKTVETHLGHAYQKLDIRGRDELAAALAGPSDRVPS